MARAVSTNQHQGPAIAPTFTLRQSAAPTPQSTLGWVGKSEPLVPCATGTGFLPTAGVQRVGAEVPRDGNPPELHGDSNPPAAPRPSSQPPTARICPAAHAEPCLPTPTTISFRFPFTGTFPSFPVGVDGEKRSGISHGGEQKELF